VRRPVVFPAMAFVLGITGQYYIKVPLWLLMVMAFIVAIIYYGFFNGDGVDLHRYILLFLVMTLFGGIWLGTADLKSSEIAMHVGETVSGEGVIRDVSKKTLKVGEGENSYKMMVIANRICGENIREKVLITCYGNLENQFSPEEFIGRTLQFKGEVSLPSQRRNPNTFDYRNHLKTLGISAIISCGPNQLVIAIPIQARKNQLMNQLSVIKGRITRTLTQIMGEEKSSVVSGMMWGEKENISEEIMEQFRMNGTAHILAVSGIHVGLIYMYLNMLFLGRKNIIVDLLIILLLICYSAMAAFSPSVVRAVTMIVIHLLSKHTYRRYDLLSCGALTMMLMLLFNPFSLFNIGFQLSFLAIFSLGVVLPFLQRYHDSFVTPVIGLQMGLAPMTGYVFNYFSFGSLIANIPIIFIASLIIPLGLLMIPLTIFHFPMSMAFVTGKVMGYLVEGMLQINHAVYSPDRSFLYMTSPSTFQMILYYFTLFFCTSEWFRILYIRGRQGLIKKIFLGVMIAALTINLLMMNGFEKAEMIFIDVGQGDCLLIKTGTGGNYLIDSGGSHNYDVGSKVLMPFLLKSGVDEIDAAFITHLHQDHYGGIVSLAGKGLVKELFVYEGYELEEEQIIGDTGLEKEQIHYLVKGDRITLAEGIFIDVLSPEERSEGEYRKLIEDKVDENKKSLIMKVMYNGISCLMTGDMDATGEAGLISQDETGDTLKADILKISHHGSRFGTSEEFIKRVNPSLAVIQVGKNNFGHPNQEVVNRITGKDINLYRNDLNGAIGISLKKSGGVKIITMYD